jgi:antitoxin FitA
MAPQIHFGADTVPNLSIKDVPESWAEALRQRAARNHRSLQGELMALIERAVGDSQPGDVREASGAAQVVAHDSRGWPVVRQGSRTAEQVFEEMKQAGAKPVRGQPLAVDILRRDRDSR